MTKQQWKFLMGGMIVVATMGILLAVSFQGNMAYYIEVGEYLDRDSGQAKGNFRVRGRVVPETIEKQPGRLGAVFEMSDGVQIMRVRYQKELPDTFVDRAEVVVEGEMGADGVFEAHTLLAKCPSKYEAEAQGG